MTLNVETLGRDDRAGFDQMLGIYRASIESSEQKPPETIAGLLQDKRYSILVARNAASVIGFAMSFLPESQDFWLLEYMAVDARARSSGVGVALFRAALSAGHSHGPCVLEVDQPGAPASANNDPAARLRFYARQGCRRVQGLSYILPLDVAGQPPPMHLLVHGLRDQASLPAATLRRWLSTIYTDVYACAAHDPRIDRMLSTLGPEVALAPL
jgi:GNAT superfamily N-acetyltransferase